MRLSLVFPTYNEADNIAALYERTAAMAQRLDMPLEIVFVDDGSIDRTPELLAGIRERDPRVEIIRFARNCGSHAAATTGLLACRGDAAVLLASDLQDPPELLPDLVARWREGSRVVWGLRRERRGESAMTLTLSRLYYAIMNRLCEVQQPPSGADVFLLDRRVIEALRGAREKHTSLFMLVAWLGFPAASVAYVKEQRFGGRSKWSLSRRLRLASDSLIAFSRAPIRFIGLIGIAATVLGAGCGIGLLVKAVAGTTVSAWSVLMALVLIMGGIQMGMLGLLGEYLWRVLDEVRGRPRVVVESSTLPPPAAVGEGGDPG